MSSSAQATRISDRPWSLALRRFVRNRAAVLGLAYLVLIVFVAFAAGWVAPYPYYEMGSSPNLAANSDNLLGTDDFGRDIFSRLVFGARVSIFVGLFSQLVVLAVGLLVGGLAGYLGGPMDAVLMRITDIQFTFPPMLIALLLLGTVVSQSVLGIVIVIGLTSWPTMARLVRGQVISVKQNTYFEAARACGTSLFKILRRHVLPNITGPLIVQATFGVANAIMIEAFLSFMGLGTPPPYPSWGGMLNAAFPWIRVHPLQTVYPAFALASTLIAINLAGDGLQEALDPRREKSPNI
jgi:ABC-type dipeptide/oligopeptide/nickel transport system permease subunit